MISQEDQELLMKLRRSGLSDEADALQAALLKRDDETDVDGFDLASERRLRPHMAEIVKGAGSVLDVVAYAEAKGGGFSVSFDTEYAALKAFYYYRHRDGVRLHKSPSRVGRDAQWVLSVPAPSWMTRSAKTK